MVTLGLLWFLNVQMLRQKKESKDVQALVLGY